MSPSLWIARQPVQLLILRVSSFRLLDLDVIKYFGFELGAQTNTNPSDDRWIINGAHEASKLQDYLDGFISKFVLCKKCKNPETKIVVKDGRILLDCIACGQRSDVDIRLKLSSYILKNDTKKGKKSKGDKKARRKAKENGEAEQNANGHPGSAGSNSDNPEEEEVVGFAEAGSDDEPTKHKTVEVKDVDNGVAPKDDEWAVDVSEEAVKARAQELSGELKQKLAFDEDEEGEGEAGGSSAYDQLGSWIIASASEKAGGVGDLDDVEIYVKAKELGIENKHKTLTVLAQTIFDDKMATQVPKRAGMLKKVSLSTRITCRPQLTCADDNLGAASESTFGRNRALYRQRALQSHLSDSQNPPRLLPGRSRL